LKTGTSILNSGDAECPAAVESLVLHIPREIVEILIAFHANVVDFFPRYMREPLLVLRLEDRTDSSYNWQASHSRIKVSADGLDGHKLKDNMTKDTILCIISPCL